MQVGMFLCHSPAIDRPVQMRSTLSHGLTPRSVFHSHTLSEYLSEHEHYAPIERSLRGEEDRFKVALIKKFD